jgi:peptide/nickel transport system ATP-binding protein
VSAHANILTVQRLFVETRQLQHPLALVRGVSVSVAAGRTLCLVGESGSGKTMTALALMRLLPGGLHARADHVSLDGDEIALDGRRGPPHGLAMIFQEPMTALNPAFTVGNQIIEALRIHQHMTRTAGRNEAIRLLDEVGIPDPASRLSTYPHQLSGGMRQRVMTAIALACIPKILIADEPTTALDVTVQAQILRLFKDLQTERGLGIVLVTHDMGVVSNAADDVAVMYAGQIIEFGAVQQVLGTPKHPYAKALLACMPFMPNGRGPIPPPPDTLAEIEGVVPPPSAWDEGCTFAPRCPFAMPKCHATTPAWTTIAENHGVACWLYEATNKEHPDARSASSES